MAWRSCLYGDGLFETIAYRAARLRLWSLHWARLQRGLARLSYPQVNESDVLSAIEDALHQQAGDAIVRLTITRQDARGYRATPNAQVAIQVQCYPFPSHTWQGQAIQSRWCATTWAQQPLLAGIKHLNRLEQVLARSEWTNPDIAEGLVCDTQGSVISGTMSALLVRHGAIVYGADLSQTGIDSVARQWVFMQLPQLGYDIQIVSLSRDMVHQADEVLLMNAVQGIGFISVLDDVCYSSSCLSDALQEDWQDKCDAILSRVS